MALENLTSLVTSILDPRHAGHWKKRQVIAVGDSLLQRQRHLICQPSHLSREVCCLPGAQIRHVMERLPRLVHRVVESPSLETRGIWTESWVMCCRWPFREVGLHDSQWCFQPPPFCDTVIKPLDFYCDWVFSRTSNSSICNTKHLKNSVREVKT